MKKRILTLLLPILFLNLTTVKAQDIEAGVFLGGSLYQGDLSLDAVTPSEMYPAFGGLFRYYFNPRINFKGNIYYGWIGGDDVIYADVDVHRHKRNLSFKSSVLDISGQIELNILPFVNGSKRYKFAPYVLTGLSVFHFNPKAMYNGSWVALQPLHTEGQGMPGRPAEYGLWQIAIPMGVGFKYGLGSGWNIGLEIASRKTFTDYLDDVSSTYPNLQKLEAEYGPMAKALSDRSIERPEYTENIEEGGRRGNPEHDDWYIFGGITITKTIRKYMCREF